MKKIFSLVLCAIMMTSVFSGCANKTSGEKGNVKITVASWPSPETTKAKYEQ